VALTPGNAARFGAQGFDEEDRAVLLEGNGSRPALKITLASALELGRKMPRPRPAPRPESDESSAASKSQREL